jgi:hypothetical protein
MVGAERELPAEIEHLVGGGFLREDFGEGPHAGLLVDRFVLGNLPEARLHP